MNKKDIEVYIRVYTANSDTDIVDYYGLTLADMYSI